MKKAMSIIDTTNVVDNSMFLKARLDKNMVGTNYYIENLQYKRNADWNMRYNVVDIEEELEKQCEYTTNPPKYCPIEVAIREVKSDRGKDLGCDWADIAFKNLKHPNFLGQRFRFNSDFLDMSQMDEDQKKTKTNTWICVNRGGSKAGNSCVIRRCNSSLVLEGIGENGESEIHYEPAILENDLKYINIYYNDSVSVPQAEWYATLQMNYFSNAIEINDRFLLGGVDTLTPSNNTIGKVKAIVKTSSNFTYFKNEKAIESIPLVILALDRDSVDYQDVKEHKDVNNDTFFLALNHPNYKIQKENKKEGYRFQIEPSYEKKILLSESVTYNVNLYKGQQKLNTNIDFSCTLENINLEKQKDYYNFHFFKNNFTIKNKKTYTKGNLVITCSCQILDKDFQKTISQKYEFELGGFY